MRIEDATWAANPAKVGRAIEALRKQNVINQATGQPQVEINDESVKELYLKWGGAIIGDENTYRGVPPVTETIDETGLRTLKIDALRKIADKLGIEHEGLKREDIIALLTE